MLYATFVPLQNDPKENRLKHVNLNSGVNGIALDPENWSKYKTHGKGSLELELVTQTPFNPWKTVLLARLTDGFKCPLRNN